MRRSVEVVGWPLQLQDQAVSRLETTTEDHQRQPLTAAVVAVQADDQRPSPDSYGVQIKWN
jgi:hypothetical protein